MKLATAADMAALDRAAVERHGIPVRTLMERAGARVAQAAGRLVGDPRGLRVVAVCGKGNNGGDGLVAARLLHASGARVAAFVVGAFAQVGADAASALDAAVRAGVDVRPLPALPALEELRALGRGADLVIDALLGTGLEGPVRGLAAEVVACVNALGVPVLAVDIPSGLSSDRGAVDGEAVAATATVTFGLPKPGLLLHPAARFVGRLWLAEIGFPQALLDGVAASTHLATPRDIAPWLAPRDAESHKGTFGHVLVVGGAPGLVGAAALAARGALRAGAGLVTVALPASLAPPFLPGLPEAMLLPLPDDPREAGDAVAGLLERIGDRSAVVLGPGLSRSPAATARARELAPRVRGPLLVDADGLAALEGRSDLLHGRAAPAVLTPHPGELARLTGLETAAVQERRLEAAREAAERFDCVTALKGARTVVAAPDGEAWINATGGPALASGGTGDVLAGAVAAHLARGIPPLAAAVLGVYLHGLAGDREAAARGPWGLLASEVADALPGAARSALHRSADEPADDGLSLLVP